MQIVVMMNYLFINDNVNQEKYPGLRLAPGNEDCVTGAAHLLCRRVFGDRLLRYLETSWGGVSYVFMPSG